MEIELLFEQNLYLYYKHLFPIQLLVEWLSYEKDYKKEERYFLRREFSFELSIRGDTVYQRYQSFPNALALQKFLFGELIQNHSSQSSPYIKYDIGAVFDKQPKKGDKMKAMEKELVIDIDMDAYDEVRKCCQGAKICEKCWKFLQVACDILRPALYEDFGLQHILAVYSGRRGIHLWICDFEIRKSQNEVRSAIISYLNINTGNAEAQEIIRETNQDSIQNLHPSIQRAYKITKASFQEIILQDQNSLVVENVKKKILTILKKNDLYSDNLAKEIQQATDSFYIWSLLDKIKTDKPEKIEVAKLEIQLMCLYPRLDAHVSTTINHLLKGPFSIHPKTQNVCVPFNLKNSSEFNPLATPTLPKILEELEKLPANMKQRQSENEIFPFLGKKIPSLQSYIQLFEDFISKYNKAKLS